jgi:hypothetical protein
MCLLPGCLPTARPNDAFRRPADVALRSVPANAEGGGGMKPLLTEADIVDRATARSEKHWSLLRWLRDRWRWMKWFSWQ